MNEKAMPMQLNTVQILSKSEVNETRICSRIENGNKELYTVLVVNDHMIMHRFVRIYDQADYLENKPDVKMYMESGRFFIVYPYVKERAITEFYMGGAMKLMESEEVCVNLIIACMTASLPWPVLYLILKQREINIAKDRGVYLGYRIDLTELSEKIGQSECTVECAKILLELLEEKNDRANSYVLLKKKCEKGTYEFFKDLYKDVTISMARKKRRGIIIRIKLWFMRNKDTIFKVLFRVSIILAIFVLLTFITNLIFGDVPWLRLFGRNFDKIGLESLLQ